jgi:hypothetical protein
MRRIYIYIYIYRPIKQGLDSAKREGNMKQKMFLYRAFIAFNLQMF